MKIIIKNKYTNNIKKFDNKDELIENIKYYILSTKSELVNNRQPKQKDNIRDLISLYYPQYEQITEN